MVPNPPNPIEAADINGIIRRTRFRMPDSLKLRPIMLMYARRCLCMSHTMIRPAKRIMECESEFLLNATADSDEIKRKPQPEGTGKGCDLVDT